jgi:hypothetical protein
MEGRIISSATELRRMWMGVDELVMEFSLVIRRG